MDVPGAPPDPAVTQVEEARVSLVESFDDFRQVDGIVLPMLWTLKLDFYKEGRGSGSANVSEMEFTFDQVRHNGPIDRESIDGQFDGQ